MKQISASIINLTKLIIEHDLILPLTLLLTYIVFLIVARGVVPTSEELIRLFEGFYAKYGYEIIFVSALLEGLVLINLFVPGMVALALGAVFARSGQTDLNLVILTASFGTILGYLVDYSLGYFGFSDSLRKLGYGGFLQTSKEKLRQFGNQGLIVGFFHSNVGSFLALAAGTIRYNFVTFFTVALVSTLVWASLWGLAAFYFGNIFLLIIKRYSFLVVLGIIGFLVLAAFWKNSGKGKNVRT